MDTFKKIQIGFDIVIIILLVILISIFNSKNDSVNIIAAHTKKHSQFNVEHLEETHSDLLDILVQWEKQLEENGVLDTSKVKIK